MALYMLSVMAGASCLAGSASATILMHMALLASGPCYFSGCNPSMQMWTQLVGTGLFSWGVPKCSQLQRFLALTAWWWNWNPRWHVMKFVASLGGALPDVGHGWTLLCGCDSHLTKRPTASLCWQRSSSLQLRVRRPV